MMQTPVGARPIVRRALFATAIVLLVAWVATVLGSMPWQSGLARGPLAAVVHAVTCNVATAVAQESGVPVPPDPPEPPAGCSMATL